MRHIAWLLLLMLIGCANEQSTTSSASQLGSPVHAPVRVTGKRNITITARVVAGHPEGIFIEGCQGLQIVGCTVSSCGTLIRVLNCRDVTIAGCTLRNPTGPPDPDGQAIQLDKCENVLVENNLMNADPGQSHVEDWISIYDSQHVVVKNNRISGGATSSSGTGICVDHTKSDDVLIEGNTLIRCGAVGVNVAGGSRITVRANRILDTFIHSPEAGNVGIAVMVGYEAPPRDVLITGNTIAVTVPGKGDSPIWDGTNRARIADNKTGKAARALLAGL